MNILIEQNGSDKQDQDTDWGCHKNTEWIVSIDMFGNVSILKAPNIHPGFLEFTNAEEIGLPFESNDPPGVYKWQCTFSESRDWESGLVDDYEFDVAESVKLFSLDDGQEPLV